jgi:hypothetical protein
MRDWCVPDPMMEGVLVLGFAVLLMVCASVVFVTLRRLRLGLDLVVKNANK